MNNKSPRLIIKQLTEYLTRRGDNMLIAYLASLQPRIEHLLYQDISRIEKHLQSLSRLVNKNSDLTFALSKLTELIKQAEQRLSWRKSNLPQPHLNQDLPIAEHFDEIMTAIRQNQIVVVAGDTGSGKTTQLPQLALKMGYGTRGLVGCTQPRRLAATGMTTRVAHELGVTSGVEVGYKIRFGDRTANETYIKFMTDGILLAETRSDPELLAYDFLILDEAHERNLNLDFLIGYLKLLLPQRPDLRLVISSATLDIERFSEFFANAPVLRVGGTAYPVEIRYEEPVTPEGEVDDDPDYPQLVAVTAEKLLSESTSGDILAFLPGERDIREATEALEEKKLTNVEILPLFARLGTAEQTRIFDPGSKRRVILSTNVAETSLTLPRIRYVIDSGLARLNRFSPKSRVQRLQIEPISQASARQRSGRSGRIGPGICVRLYSRTDLENRPEFTDPEILRVNLAGVILRMQELNLGNVHEFPFLDAPSAAQIREGLRELAELGAIDSKQKITALGRKLAHLPVEPRLGKMLIAAESSNCLAEMLVITAGLSVQDPRDRPLSKRAEADFAHQTYMNNCSDFLGLLALWQNYCEFKDNATSRTQVRRWCRDHFISYLRMEEWLDIHNQLAARLHSQSHGREFHAEADELHKALLSGMLSRIGKNKAGDERREKHDYLAGGGKKFRIWPGSGLAGTRPPWIMAAELVETSQLWGRTCAIIQPDWIEQVAGDLAKRSYSDPHWDANGGFVRAYEQVTVIGLTIVERRPIHYGPLDPKLSRDIFIREALVKGDFHPASPFQQHNRQVIESATTLESKARRRDLTVDSEALFNHFDKIIPADIYSGPLFERWRQEAEKKRPDLLFLRREDVLLDDGRGITPELFPDNYLHDSKELPVSYKFAPGEDEDGATLTLTVGDLSTLQPWRLDWLVPGFLGERIACTLRELPKSIRRNFVPVPDTVEAVLKVIIPGQYPFSESLNKALDKLGRGRIAAADFPVGDKYLPRYIIPNLRVVDGEGKVLKSGKNPEQLLQELAVQAETAFIRANKVDYERRGLKVWDFKFPSPDSGESDALPEIVRLPGNDATRAVPALVDEGNSVGIRLFSGQREALMQHRGGLLRFVRIALDTEIRHLKRQLPGSRELHLAIAACGLSYDNYLEHLILAALLDAYIDSPAGGAAVLRSGAAFTDRMRSRRPIFARNIENCYKILSRALPLAQSLLLKLAGIRESAMQPASQEIKTHLSELIAPKFPLHYGIAALLRYSQYIEALSWRLERLKSGIKRDEQRSQQVKPWRAKLIAANCNNLECGNIAAPEYMRFQYLIEEYCISVFAQEIGTAESVSPNRLESAWQQYQIVLKKTQI